MILFKSATGISVLALIFTRASNATQGSSMRTILASRNSTVEPMHWTNACQEAIEDHLHKRLKRVISEVSLISWCWIFLDRCGALLQIRKDIQGSDAHTENRLVHDNGQTHRQPNGWAADKGYGRLLAFNDSSLPIHSITFKSDITIIILKWHCRSPMPNFHRRSEIVNVRLPSCLNTKLNWTSWTNSSGRTCHTIEGNFLLRAQQRTSWGLRKMGKETAHQYKSQNNIFMFIC